MSKVIVTGGVEWEWQPGMASWTNDAGEAISNQEMDERISDNAARHLPSKIEQSLLEAVTHFETIGLGNLPMVCEWRANLMEAGVIR